jgi:hypothetical protein
MTTIMPQGEDIRKAVKWISEERQSSPGRKLSKLVEEAAVRFNLSPAEGEYLSRFFTEQKG